MKNILALDRAAHYCEYLESIRKRIFVKQQIRETLHALLCMLCDQEIVAELQAGQLPTLLIKPYVASKIKIVTPFKCPFGGCYRLLTFDDSFIIRITI